MQCKKTKKSSSGTWIDTPLSGVVKEWRRQGFEPKTPAMARSLLYMLEPEKGGEATSTAPDVSNRM